MKTAERKKKEKERKGGGPQFLQLTFWQFFLFPPVTNWLGSRVCLRFAAFTLPAVYGVLPFVLLVPASVQMTAIYVLMFFKSLAMTFAFPCSTILLTNSAPSLRVLGSECTFAYSEVFFF